MTGADDTRRKRLLFRSWHRGTKETDLLLGSFAEQHLAGFTADRLISVLNRLGAQVEIEIRVRPFEPAVWK